jgi:hypothetical protein
MDNTEKCSSERRKVLAASGILVISIFCALHVSAQKKQAPFSILVVTPDTARAEPELTVIFKLLEERYRQIFYQSSAELAANAGTSGNKKEIAKLEWQFGVISNMDTKIKDLKFYHVISKVACVTIIDRFKTMDRSSIAEVNLDKGRKRILYDSLPFDSRWQYMLSYKNLSATKGAEAIMFSGTIHLLDIKTNQVVLEKGFTGKSKNNYVGSAEDALHDFVEISSNAVADFILSRQKK